MSLLVHRYNQTRLLGWDEHAALSLSEAKGTEQTSRINCWSADAALVIKWLLALSKLFLWCLLNESSLKNDQVFFFQRAQVLLSPWKVLRHLFVCVFDSSCLILMLAWPCYDTIMYFYVCVCSNELLLGSIPCESQCIGPHCCMAAEYECTIFGAGGNWPRFETPGGLSKQGGSHTNWKGNNETSFCATAA